MKSLIVSALSILFTSSFSQEKINVIIIGTNHFNNSGHDAAKPVEMNILEDYRQEGLEKITNKIIKKIQARKSFCRISYTRSNYIK